MLNIKNYCDNRGIKYCALAKTSNISPRRFYKLIQIPLGKLKLDEYIAITKALGVPFDYFIKTEV